MDDNNDFIIELEDALNANKQNIETNNMSEIKEIYNIFLTSFHSIYNLLLKKGLIHEDPYKSEDKKSDIILPPSGPIAESDKKDQFSIRLSKYESQLDFLCNYYHFSLEYLNLGNIKPLVSLTKYINWDKLTTTSTNLNTRIMAENIIQIRQGSDNFSANIIKDALNQLSAGTIKALRIIKNIIVYQKESYKLLLRKELISDLNLNSQKAQAQRDDTLKIIRKNFANKIQNQPFYRELIEQILDEDFSPQKDKLREDLMNKLKPKETQKQKETKAIPFKQMLIEALRILASSGFQIQDSIQKLNVNATTLEERQLSLGEKFKKVIIKLFNIPTQNKYYEITYFDEKTSTNKTEKIDFSNFSEETVRKARLYIAISSKNHPHLKKIETYEEDELFTYVSKNIQETQNLLKRFIALDDYFKDEIPNAKKNKLKGIKLEVNAIKNSIVKANQKRYEYVSQKEEIEQLKKLGIKSV